ncbi:MAG: ABC transporter substrate-binding protein [Gammaproteobacteria bacterium]
MRRFLLLLLIGALGAPAARSEVLAIGYLELERDGRYDRDHLAARFLGQPLGRPYPGAEVALHEVKFHGAEINLEFALKRSKAQDGADLARRVEEMHQQGVRFFLIDAPAPALAEAARATQGKDLLLFNVSAPDDDLRQEQCAAHVLHTIPSHAMLMDAIIQYLVARKWTQVLMLEGPDTDDKLLSAAFEHSAKRYGAKIVAKRGFVLSNDPRQRDQNNVALLTAAVDYDVVFVADANGEFARDVPYQGIKPQLVVGSEGLTSVAWHWAWERQGAPQLNNRFQHQAKRDMRDVDWAAWVAVKAIAEAVQSTSSADFKILKDYLFGDTLQLDGFKGAPMSFRRWDHQLRQPLLLVTHNWVVARAPIAGFLHQTNNLDTLGFDQADSQCKF